jgi:CHAT domain-containing protein/tetratricopeptide (TPR) repeat protein
LKGSPLAGLLSLFALSLIACDSRHDPVPGEHFPAVSCSAESPSAARSSPLRAINGELLRRGETHAYKVPLSSGEFLQVVADQAEADLVLCFYGPERRLLLAVDSPNGQDEPEEILWEASDKGTYWLVVQGVAEESAQPRSYGLAVHGKGRATTADRKRLAAVVTTTRAEELRRSHSPRDWPIAQGAYARALALWKELGDLHRQADIQARLGRLYRTRLGDVSHAFEAYSRARMLFAQIGDRRQETKVLIILGQTALESDRPEEALGLENRALELATEVGDRRDQAVALHEIGHLSDLLGEAHRSLDAYSRALERWSGSTDDAARAETLHARGILYYSLGQYGAALDDLEEARALRTGTASKLASTLTWIGMTHAAAGRPEEALPLLKQALELRVASRDRRGEAATESALGSILQQLGRRSEGLERHRHAFEIYVHLAGSRDKARAYYNLGRALQGVDRLAEAGPSLQRALEGARKSGDGALVEASLFALAELKRGQGDKLAALGLIREALDHVEVTRLKSTSLDLRSAFLSTKQDYYDFLVDLLIELERSQPGKGYRIQAFEASERGRARSLLDLLQESGTELREGVPVELTAAKRRLENAIRAKNRLILEDSAVGNSKQGPERELRQLLDEHDRIVAEVRSRSPGYRSLIQAQPLTAEQIQRQVLDTDTLLLHYKLGRRKSYLFVVSPRSVETFALPPRDVLERLATRVYKLLSTGDQGASEAQAEITLRKLGEILLGPARQLLGKKRLLVVGEGALQSIPFAALSISSDADGKPFPLMVDHEIVTMPSASALGMLKSQQSERSLAPKGIAVIADPVFSIHDDRFSGRSLRPGLTMAAGPLALGDIPVYERLRFSRNEAEAIALIANDQQTLLALDFAANRHLVLSGALGAYRIVHFATHAEIDSLHPELSRLVLSLVDEQGRPREGFLYSHDVFALRFPAELVVLSACETGMGHEIRGEGLVGLPQAFLYAGAARVVVSLWKVQDRSTAELFSSFYRYLMRGGKTPSAALREAQIEQWRKQPEGFQWAAFVTEGRWR